MSYVNVFGRVVVDEEELVSSLVLVSAGFKDGLSRIFRNMCDFAAVICVIDSLPVDLQMGVFEKIEEYERHMADFGRCIDHVSTVQ